MGRGDDSEWFQPFKSLSMRSLLQMLHKETILRETILNVLKQTKNK